MIVGGVEVTSIIPYHVTYMLKNLALVLEVGLLRNVSKVKHLEFDLALPRLRLIAVNGVFLVEVKHHSEHSHQCSSCEGLLLWGVQVVGFF
jgi:hypothetical protein